jgi:hypothetical protein
MHADKTSPMFTVAAEDDATAILTTRLAVRWLVTKHRPQGLGAAMEEKAAELEKVNHRGRL